MIVSQVTFICIALFFLTLSDIVEVKNQQTKNNKTQLRKSRANDHITFHYCANTFSIVPFRTIGRSGTSTNILNTLKGKPLNFTDVPETWK